MTTDSFKHAIERLDSLYHKLEFLELNKNEAEAEDIRWEIRNLEEELYGFELTNDEEESL